MVVVHGELGKMLVCIYPKFLMIVCDAKWNIFLQICFHLLFHDNENSTGQLSIWKNTEVGEERILEMVFSLCWEKKKYFQKSGSLVLVSFLLIKLLKSQKIIELSPFSLFIKPGLLTLKQHSDRGAERKKCLQEKNRKERGKDPGRVSVLGCSSSHTLRFRGLEYNRGTAKDRIFGEIKFLNSKECKDFYLFLIACVWHLEEMKTWI